LRSRPLMSNKDQKRRFSRKKLRVSSLQKSLRLLTKKKSRKSIRLSSLNLKLPESPRKLRSKSVSLSRRKKLRNTNYLLFNNRLLLLKSKSQTSFTKLSKPSKLSLERSKR